MSVYIIAEAGVNHNGSLETAMELVDVAFEAGANAVKFQSFHAESLVCSYAGKAEYQVRNTGAEENQLQMLKKLELSQNIQRKLMKYCEKKGITFLSSPFHIESVYMLSKMGMETFKIPSGEITDLPYLRAVASVGKKIILSTGMSDMKEIEAALQVLKEGIASEIYILHCNTEYPTPLEDVNLRAMLAIKEKFGLPVGYSDHTVGIEVPIAAVALGASAIEKHFTLDRNMKGPDHRASLEPTELKQMIKAIRNIETALGDSEKRPSASEEKNRLIARKSIVARGVIKKGDIFSEDNITAKRPGTGISPMLWDEIIGRAAKRDFQMDEMIEL